MNPFEQNVLDRIAELYEQMYINSTDTLTLAQAARFLGKAENSVLDLYHKRKIGAFKPEERGRGTLYFDKQELENYKRRNRIPSNEETESMAATYNHLKRAS